jgi:hypothetical protein
VDIQKDFSWLQHHLILVAVLLAAVAGGVWGVQSIIEKHDLAAQLRAHEDLAAVVEQVKSLEQKQATDDAAAQVREAQANALIQTLVAQVNARDKALDDQIRRNGTLTAQQAAARLVEQYKAQPGAAQAQGDNVLVDLPLTRQIVSTFDSLQTCKADLVDTQSQLTAEKGKNADQQSQISDRDKVIAAKDVELLKQKKADDEDKKVAVDKEKKKHKWYALAGAAIVTGIKIYFSGKV